MITSTGNREALERMKTDFFVYKGVKYPAGTMFKMKDPKYDFLDDVTAVYHGNIESIYPGKYCIGYNTNFDIASSFKCKNGLLWKTMIGIEKDKLADMIVEILPGNNFINTELRKKYVADSNDENLLMGWIIYIILMVVNIIFKKNIMGWIILSIIFFGWRYIYKEMECVYYE